MKTIREKLLLQKEYLAKIAGEISRKSKGRRSLQTVSVVKELKLKAVRIQKEIAETVQVLPLVALLACPENCGPVSTSFEFAKATKLIRRSREFLIVARKAIAERDRVEGKARPCDAACVARVRERKARIRAELRYIRELARETITTIRATPRIDQ